jgi:hypothetical protein
MAFKEDLLVSVAELVYGEPLRIPGELVTPTVDPMNPASHHRAPQAHGQSQTGSSSTPFLPGHIRAWRPRGVHSRLPLSGHNEPGFGAPYSGPYRPITEKEDTTTPCAREARHCVNRQGEDGLHPQWV